MRFPLTVSCLLLCLSALGCAEEELDDPAVIELTAATPNISYDLGAKRPAFAVGLRSELRAHDGSRRMLKAVSCTEGCRVESLPSQIHPRFPSFRLTPLAKTFKVHVTAIGTHGSESPDVVFDRELTAVDAPLATEQDGAGPGTPFVEGMTLTWRLGVKDPSAAWEPARSNVTVTPPFTLANRGASLDRVVVDIRASAPGRGTLVHRNGDVEVRHELIAVALADIRALHAVRVTEGLPNLRAANAGELVITGRTKLWIAFETTGGVFGLGGAGESLPAPGANFTVRAPNDYQGSSYVERDVATLRSQPQLALEPTKPGRSKLLLRVGDVQDSVDVVVQ